MARQRNKPTKDDPTTNNNKESKVMSEMSAFVEIDDLELDQALAGSRSRGIYDENLLAFFETGRRGVQINLEDGVHEGKKAQSVKTGYESARERLVNGKVAEATEEQVEAAKNTKVIGKTNPDRVFLFRSDIQKAA